MSEIVRRALALLGLMTLLTACGGGSEESASISQAGDRRSALATTPTPTSTSTPLDLNALFDWAELTYPQYFPGHKASQVAAPYDYRYYPESRNYLGVAGDGVFVLGPISNQQVLRVGNREEFRCRVRPQDCVVSYARKGWTATLSSLAHGVSGTATIVDERTIRFNNFRYDGNGPRVYAYLGRMDSPDAFASGRSIGDPLRQPYNNEVLELRLPEGQTLDDYNAVSIWCVAFNANFGSGSFAAPAK